MRYIQFRICCTILFFYAATAKAATIVETGKTYAEVYNFFRSYELLLGKFREYQSKLYNHDLEEDIKNEIENMQDKALELEGLGTAEQQLLVRIYRTYINKEIALLFQSFGQYKLAHSYLSNSFTEISELKDSTILPLIIRKEEFQQYNLSFKEFEKHYSSFFYSLGSNYKYLGAPVLGLPYVEKAFFTPNVADSVYYQSLIFLNDLYQAISLEINRKKRLHVMFCAAGKIYVDNYFQGLTLELQKQFFQQILAGEIRYIEKSDSTFEFALMYLQQNSLEEKYKSQMIHQFVEGYENLNGKNQLILIKNLQFSRSYEMELLGKTRLTFAKFSVVEKKEWCDYLTTSKRFKKEKKWACKF